MECGEPACPAGLNYAATSRLDGVRRCAMGDMSPPVIVESRITRYSRGTRTTHYLFAVVPEQLIISLLWTRCKPNLHFANLLFMLFPAPRAKLEVRIMGHGSNRHRSLSGSL